MPEAFDPRTITGGDWSHISALVFFLWLVVIFNVSFAFAILFGHAVIPSLTATGHIPAVFHRIRPFFYVLGLIALGVSVVVIANWLIGMGTVYDIYPKRLI